MDNASEPAFLNPEFSGHGLPARNLPGGQRSGPRRGTTGGASSGGVSGPGATGREPGTGRSTTPALGRAGDCEAGAGVLKAMSPGVVDFLFRRLVAGEPAEDVQWGREGTALAVAPPGAELARRLADTDLDALTPTELFHYVRAAQRLASWAESLREAAVGRYCSFPAPSSARSNDQAGGGYPE